jgi:type VI secretion system protein ImpK
MSGTIPGGDDDRTVMRPRLKAAPPPPAPRPVSATAPAALPAAGDTNPLMQSAASLLLLAAHIREMFQPPDAQLLRSEAMQAVRDFEARARQLNVANDLLLTARYVVCTMLDEAVLGTPWGARSGWGNQTLLMAFHHEAWGGEKFFQVLDRASADPARYQHLLELLYVCLSLGFAGKYRVAEGGADKLVEIRHALYQRIRGVSAATPGELSPHWQGAARGGHALSRVLPLWVAGAAAAFVLCAVFAFCYVRLSALAEPVAASFAQIGLETIDRPPPPPAPVAADLPTLKRLLAGEEQAGHLDVSEYGDRSVVSLHGDQFASASAEPTAQTRETLAAVAQAINRLAGAQPGRVVVQGHTDDAPLRSLRYANNHELSAERAKAAAGLLKTALAATVPIEAVGRGADQPRCTPPGTRENRACNRRVEIVYFLPTTDATTGGADVHVP